MDIQEQIQYWIDTAEHDLQTAEHLFEKGDYAWCLFIGHLVLEKTLKAVFVRDNQQIPPRTHNLVMLANATTKIKEYYQWLKSQITFSASSNATLQP